MCHIANVFIYGWMMRDEGKQVVRYALSSSSSNLSTNDNTNKDTPPRPCPLTPPIPPLLSV